jgi:hypothetical protein
MTDKKYDFLFILSTFFATALFSLGVIHFSTISWSVSALLYISYLVFVFKRSLAQDLSNTSNFSALETCMGYLLAMYSALILVHHWTEANMTLLWMPDSLKYHFPASQEVARALMGKMPWSETQIGQPGMTTHFLVGLATYLYGRGVESSLLALFFLKLLTCVAIFRLGLAMAHRRLASIATLIYIFAPTTLFYTITFYKEAAVHCYMAWTLYLLYLVFNKQKVTVLPALFLVLFLLSRERFYLPLLFVPSLALWSFISFKKLRWLTMPAGLSLLAYLFFTNDYLQQGPQWVITRLVYFRELHTSFSDVSFTYNYEIPYLVALIKSFLTPIFSFNKFAMFKNYASLLIWGSFVNQAIIIASMASAIILVRKSFREHFPLLLPFLIYMLLMAYISPWNGRPRDSFYPLFAIYSGLFLTENYWIVVKSWLNTIYLMVRTKWSGS